MSKSRQWKMFVFVLIGIICFSSCADVKRVIGPERYKRMESAVKKFDQAVANAYKKVGLDDSDRIRVEAGALGATVGAIIGQVSGRDTKSTVIGGAIGAIAGFAAGDAVAKRKEQYKTREEKVAKEIDRVSTLVSELRQANQNLKYRISQLENETERIKTSVAKWSYYKLKLKEHKEKIKKEMAAARIIHKALVKELKDAEEIYSDVKANKIAKRDELAALQKKIEELKENKSALVDHVEKLSSMNDNIVID